MGGGKRKEGGYAEVLDACEYGTSNILRWLLETERDDSEVWPSVIKLLKTEVAGRNIVVLLIGLLRIGGLYSRATRLWLEVQELKLTAPDLVGFKLVRVRLESRLTSRLPSREEAYALDLHTCTPRAANIVVSTELRHFKDLKKEQGHVLVQIITGRGNHSQTVGQSVVQQVVTRMLDDCYSPFVTSSKNSGVLEARLGEV